MNLQSYIEATGQTLDEIANIVGCSYETIRRYLKINRIPKPNLMRKIYTATGGKVTPNDFFNLAKPGKRPAQSRSRAGSTAKKSGSRS